MNSNSNKRFQLLILMVSLASGIFIGFATKMIFTWLFLLYFGYNPGFSQFSKFKTYRFFRTINHCFSYLCNSFFNADTFSRVYSNPFSFL